MANSEFKNAPPLYGWAIGVAAGVLMFGVSLLVLDIGGNGSVAIGVVVALIVGLIFTFAETKPEASTSHNSGAADATAGAGAVSAAKAAAPVAKSTAPAADTAPGSAATSTATPAPANAAPATPAAAAASSAATQEVEAEQPKGLDAPVGTKDDLKRISGVGPVLEGKLNGLGFFHFWQIAKWTRAEVEWVDGYLSFKGRIDRDNWISQATKLAEESPSKPPA
jgi:NADH-quinone oxidoreductase subunit E